MRLFQAVRRTGGEIVRCLRHHLQAIYFLEQRLHLGLAGREWQPLFARCSQFVDDPMPSLEAVGTTVALSTHLFTSH